MPSTERRARYRAILRNQARTFYQRHAIWTTRNMSIGAVQRDWRIALIVGPDTRSLTGRQFGDPRYERSALFAKRMGWA